jgi:general secretion pathway protein A
MYKRFFGLTRNPFEISPDPAFLVPTPRHNEALANLYYGVRRQKGFVVVTGEVGTGKTLLLKCLLDVLNHDQIAFAYVFNPRLTVPQFFQYVLGDLGIKGNGVQKSEMLLALNNFLISRYRKSQTTVLVVDEAQHLSRELLEEIRLLTNLETGQQKLLQIILAGQPELEQKLDASDLRQLKQRVALRCRLEPLTVQETRTYINRRLQLAGGSAGTLFPDETVEHVHHFSKGIPRLINTLCENALIIAYARQLKQVSPEFVDEVAADFRLNITTPPQRAENDEFEPHDMTKKQLIGVLMRILEAIGGDAESSMRSQVTAAGRSEE